jgi:hypothetical protein
MPRIDRIVAVDCPHHIVQRGNNRQDVFFVDDDRYVYLELLKEQCDKYGLEVLAYCLMTNHIHLVAIPHEEDSLAGYEYHGPKGHLGFTPRLTPENFRAAFTAAEGWGTFVQKLDSRIQSERIEMRWGQLALKSLVFTVPEDFGSVKVSVMVAGQPIETDYSLNGSRLEITLKKKTALSENQALEITITRQR